MFSKAISLLALTSAVSVSAYPSKWITNEDGNITATAVPRSALAVDCNQDANGAYTCVSISQDVTRVESSCVDGKDYPSDFSDLFNMRDQACDSIHCRTDKPITLKRLDTKCNGYDITMTLDGNYLNDAGKNAYYDMTLQAFSAASKQGKLSGSQCGTAPGGVGPPPVIPTCWNTGPTNVQVSTFGGPYSGQYMETTLSIVHEDDKFLCDFILGAVNAAAGRISPESSGILGSIGGICG